MIKKAYEGSIDYMQILDEKGNIDQQLMPKDLDDRKAVEMYKYMSFQRALDAKVLSLQRQGRADTYAPTLGQEAVDIGSALAMGQYDLFVPNFRQHGVFLVRGLPLDTFFLYWKGYEDGSKEVAKIGGFPYIVPVATQIPHAVGAAVAQKYKGTGGAVVTYVGDGGTSEGNFYEGINFAGAMGAPVVVIIENNGWAISEPVKRQGAAQTLVQKSIAAGIRGIQVDGNDVFAIYKAVKDAIADSKNGPTLIECLTYRMSMHTTADDPTKYRDDALVETWKPKDPILRLRTYLTNKGLWNDALENAMAADQLKKIDDGVEKAEQFAPDPKTMFETVYSFMPQQLQQEEDAAIAANWWKD